MSAVVDFLEQAALIGLETIGIFAFVTVLALGLSQLLKRM